ncbi:MAG: 4-alpha-glucanotransferase [Acidimicrobiia bacterium]
MSRTSPLPRSGGILLHPTSLPGTGIGDLGEHAHRFARLIRDMGLRWWQMLPVGPTGYGDSPYQSPSTFAGNPLLIPTDLPAGSQPEQDEATVDDFPADRVDFGRVIPWKRQALDAITAHLLERPPSAEFLSFVEVHRSVWLHDFAIFTALKRAHRLAPWWEWPDDLRHRRPQAIRSVERSLAHEIARVEVEQFLFDQAFGALRRECGELGIGLIGDIPIFVAADSADVWANRHLFLLDEAGNPTVVAGVPPDYFSATGQRWGNPLYDWDVHKATGFGWWEARMRRTFEMFDLVRIDHFRGFVASWHIPASEQTAVEGEWVSAPGRELFGHLQATFGDLPVIAEDLGLITPEVEALRDEFDLPGMKVLQFGFGTESAHALDQFRPNVVAYTGTHDNDTARGWFESADPTRTKERQTALATLGTDGSDFAWDLIEAVFESVAAVAVVPLQDVLSLGSRARMNTPGTDTGNWRWRFDWHQLDAPRIERMRSLVERTDRR